MIYLRYSPNIDVSEKDEQESIDGTHEPDCRTLHPIVLGELK